MCEQAQQAQCACPCTPMHTPTLRRGTSTLELENTTLQEQCRVQCIRIGNPTGPHRSASATPPQKSSRAQALTTLSSKSRMHGESRLVAHCQPQVLCQNFTLSQLVFRSKPQEHCKLNRNSFSIGGEDCSPQCPEEMTMTIKESPAEGHDICSSRVAIQLLQGRCICRQNGSEILVRASHIW